MTYEYLCTACGHAWEAEQSISEAPLKECPSCKQATAKRQVSGGAGFILKGGGWYSDLYGSPKPKADGSGEGSKSSSSTSTSTVSTPSESKPADTKKSEAPSGGGSTGKSESAPVAS